MARLKQVPEWLRPGLSIQTPFEPDTWDWSISAPVELRIEKHAKKKLTKKTKEPPPPSDIDRNQYTEWVGYD